MSHSDLSRASASVSGGFGRAIAGVVTGSLNNVRKSSEYFKFFAAYCPSTSNVSANWVLSPDSSYSSKT